MCIAAEGKRTQHKHAADPQLVDGNPPSRPKETDHNWAAVASDCDAPVLFYELEEP